LAKFIPDASKVVAGTIRPRVRVLDSDSVEDELLAEQPVRARAATATTAVRLFHRNIGVPFR